MKRIFFNLAILVLVPLAVPQVHAQSEVSLDFFYDNLNDGNWIEVGDYGYCWQPNVAVDDSDWRPYADGYWAYTDVGWTWVSYEDFGWATYHYGSWIRLVDQGWVWVPGYEWGPAWVSWRTGDDYIGWAPLPPLGERFYEGGAITGQVDIEFNIGPACYNFVEVRYFGEPVLRGRLIRSAQNVTIINRTMNVTNITRNKTVVINRGPDFNRVNLTSLRPVQRLTLEHNTNAVLGRGTRGNEITKVQGNKLLVAGPVRLQKSTHPVAPAKVKAKIPQARLESGWAGISEPRPKQPMQMPSNPAAKLEQGQSQTNTARNPLMGNTIPRGSAAPIHANTPIPMPRTTPVGRPQVLTTPTPLQPNQPQRPIDARTNREAPVSSPVSTAGPDERMVPPQARRGAQRQPRGNQQPAGQGAGKKGNNQQDKNASPEPTPR
jgi:hypothetical protein